MSELEQPVAPTEENRPSTQTAGQDQPIPEVLESAPKLDLQDEEPSGLVTLREGVSNTYVVLVQGIANREWKAQKRWETWMAWFDSMGLKDDHTIKAYYYDIASEDPGLFNVDGIEKESRKLLEVLAGGKTEKQDPNRRYIFIALDIGGIIVKKALILASMAPTMFGDLDYRTSGLIFASCPHRPATIEEAEDYIGELLSLNSCFPPDCVRKIRELARTVQAINKDFLETKYLIRALICNIVSPRARSIMRDTVSVVKGKDEDDDSDSDSDSSEEMTAEKDTGSYTAPPSLVGRSCSWFAIPFELVLHTQMSYLEITTASSGSEAELLSGKCLDRLKSALKPAREANMDMDMHCVSLSRAPPLYPPKRQLYETPSGDSPGGILTSEQYKQWLDHRGTCVLHLHGISGVSAITQQLTESLNSSKDRKHGAILFEFNHRDIRFSSMKACFSYILAVLSSRIGELYPELIRELIQDAYCEHDGNLDDLYAVLVRMQMQPEVRGLTFILSRVDECDESWAWMVKRLSVRRHRHRYPFSWIISSQGSDAIKAELSGWPAINIDGCGLTKDMHLGTSQGHLHLSSYLACGFQPFSEGELAILASLQGDAIQDKESHAAMAWICLKYLRDPAVQDQMLAFCNHRALTRPPLYTDHQNLISYATLYWPLHYKLSGEDRPFQSAVDFFNDRQARNTWSSVQYVLCNSGSWLDRCYLSPLPLMAMHGLDDLVSEWLHREKSCELLQTDGALAAREAARGGHISTARLLLAAVDLNESALADVLTAAASFGEGGMIHEVACIASNIDGFQWPRFLLHRLAFLDLYDTAKLLLDSGVRVNTPKPDGWTPLHYVSSFGRTKTLQILLEASPDIDYRDEDGYTALHFSARVGSPDSIRLLLDAGAAIDAQTDSGMTPLQLALYWGNIGAFKILLESGADPNHGKEDQYDAYSEMKPLFYCAWYGLTEETKLLLAHNADINIKYWSGELSAVHFAVCGGYVEVATLLYESGADPNENPKNWDMVLLAAVDDPVQATSLALTRLLLDHGALIEQEDSSNPWRNTALSRASGTAHTEVVKLLLDRGANPNHCGTNSHSPLYTACHACQLENVRLLITAGANVHEVPSDADEWSPIHAGYDSAEIVKALLDNGADANRLAGRETCLHLAARNYEAGTVRVLLAHRPKIDLELTIESPDDEEDDNYTALCLACRDAKGARIARRLLDAGANANHQTKLGKRPLDICVAAGSTAVARVLLQYRAPVNTVDNNGNTPLHQISSLTERGLVKLLVRAGLDPWEPNSKGITPLRRAVEVGNSAVVKLLLSRDSSRNRLLDGAPSLVRLACQNNDLQTLKALVAAGADIKSLDSMPGADGLLVTAIDKGSQGLVEYLVEIGGVNINGPGGSFGYPLIAACAAYGTLTKVKCLLRYGADIQLQDSTGRTALCLASVRGVLPVVEALLSATGTHMAATTASKDKMGRTPVHFAAASGDWDVFKRVRKLYGEKELTEPDYDGWTPLFWAVRNRNPSGTIVQYLIEHGNDPWARDQNGNGNWSPIKVARYMGAPEDFLVALVEDSPSRDKNSTGEEFHDSKQAQYHEGWTCDSCRLTIAGIRYNCHSCEDYDLCFRCYMSRELFHSDHTQDRWSEYGPEFEDDTSSEGQGDYDERTSSSTEPSDSGTDSADTVSSE